MARDPTSHEWTLPTHRNLSKNIAHPDHPLVLGPILPGNNGYQWDLFDGRVVVLRIDSSARAMRIKPDGRIPDKDGRDILTGIDPGIEYHPVLRHPRNQ